MTQANRSLPPKLEAVPIRLGKAASLGPDDYDHMTEEYQRMAVLASSVTLDELHRDSIAVHDIEDAVA